MDSGNEGTFFTSGLFLGVIVAWIAAIFYYEPMYSDQVNMAIEQCEQKLPRNQHCRYIITAEVEDVN